MPPFYLGGGTNPFSGFGGQPVTREPVSSGGPPPGSGLPNPTGPVPGAGNPPLTGNAEPAAPPATPQGNVLGAQTVRATGPAQGYDPSYLQNLATAIGGLFSRPQGNLSFNPLGDLSSISPQSGMGGNAPLPGLPSTWLQDALNGLGFNFAPQTPAPTAPTNPANGGGNPRGGNNGNPFGPASL